MPYQTTIELLLEQLGFSQTTTTTQSILSSTIALKSSDTPTHYRGDTTVKVPKLLYPRVAMAYFFYT